MRKGRTVLQAKRYGIHSCGPETSLLYAAQRMVDDEVSCLVVVDEAGYLLGIITRMQVLKAHVELDNWATRCVSDHMERELVTVTPQALLVDVAQQLIARGIRQVVVVLEEEGRERPMALLTDADLMYHVVKGP